MKVFRQMYQRGEMSVRWAWWEGTLWGNQLNERADSVGEIKGGGFMKAYSENDMN